VCFVLFIICLYVCVCECLIQNNNHKTKHKCNTNCGSTFEPGASGLPYYCTSIFVRFGCTRLASCVDSKPKIKKNCHGSIGQVPLPENEISHGTPRTCTRCSYMYKVFREKFRIPGGGPDQLNCCKEAAAGSLLTCRSSCSFVSQVGCDFQ